MCLCVSIHATVIVYVCMRVCASEIMCVGMFVHATGSVYVCVCLLYSSMLVRYMSLG